MRWVRIDGLLYSVAEIKAKVTGYEFNWAGVNWSPDPVLINEGNSTTAICSGSGVPNETGTSSSIDQISWLEPTRSDDESEGQPIQKTPPDPDPKANAAEDSKRASAAATSLPAISSMSRRLFNNQPGGGISIGSLTGGVRRSSRNRRKPNRVKASEPPASVVEAKPLVEIKKDPVPDPPAMELIPLSEMKQDPDPPAMELIPLSDIKQDPDPDPPQLRPLVEVEAKAPDIPMLDYYGPDPDPRPPAVVVDEVMEQLPSDEWVVEAIVEKKFEANGVPYYRVKWLGWPSSDNTWEPVENCHNSMDLVHKFEEQEAKDEENKRNLEAQEPKRKPRGRNMRKRKN